MAMNKESSERDSRIDALNYAAALRKSGITPSASDMGLGADRMIGNRVGGTVSWRHNNPGNIKYGDFSKKYGAVAGQKATDGGSFAVFSTIEDGERAQKDLLTGERYASLELNQAMKVWSGGVSATPTSFDKVGFYVQGLGKRYLSSGGYTYKDLIPSGAPNVEKSLDQFTDDELKALQAAMKNREGWEEGTLYGGEEENEEELALSTSVKAGVLKDLNIAESEAEEFFGRKLTESDWIKLQDTYENESRVTDEDDAVMYAKKLKDENQSPEDIFIDINATYGRDLNNAEIQRVMRKAGYVFNERLKTWSLK
jgi:hypothetical protein